jgi:hypothetical protein
VGYDIVQVLKRIAGQITLFKTVKQHIGSKGVFTQLGRRKIRRAVTGINYLVVLRFIVVGITFFKAVFYHFAVRPVITGI